MKRIDHFLRFYIRKLKENELYTSDNRCILVDMKTLFKLCYTSEREKEKFESSLRVLTMTKKLPDVESVLNEYNSSLNNRLRLWNYAKLINFLNDRGLLNAFTNNLKSAKKVNTVRDYIMNFPFAVDPRRLIMSAFIWGMGETPCDWRGVHLSWLNYLYEEFEKEMQV